MKKIFLLAIFTLFSLGLFSLSANAHPAKKHKPLVCIPEEERTKSQLSTQKTANWFHRMTKLQQDCAMLEIEKQRKKIEKIGELATCPSVPFNHLSSKDTNLFLKPDEKSKILEKIKKGQEMLFISEPNQNWSYVSVKVDESCIEGFVIAKNIIAKDDQDKSMSVGSSLISIIEPSWKVKNKLISIDAEGTVSLIGAVQEGKIDQIIVNEEEEDIQSDQSFSHLIFVPKSGAEVRIVGNKNGQKIKELIFKIKVGQ
tara:strand:- start:245 stop:1012 length:768 start_codon:yes stop_codon:yes gene_type:complete